MVPGAAMAAAPTPAAPAPAAVAIAVTTQVAPAAVSPGQDATITVTARNDGAAVARAVRVSVPLPSRLTLVRATPGQGTVAGSLWTVGDVAAKKSIPLTLVVRGTAGATVTAVAALVGAGGGGVATAVLRISGRRADLALTTAAGAPSGAQVNYTLTVANAGPDPASEVVVRDDGPASLVAATPSVGAFNPITRVWTVGELAKGAKATLMVRATGGTPRSAYVTSSTLDPKLTDNATAAVVAATSPAADLAVSAALSAPTVRLGQTVTLTVGARNGGPSAATGVAVRATLPAGLDAVSSTGPGDYDLATGRWSVGALPPGATASRQVVARASAAGQGIVVVALAAADQPDPRAADNVAIAPATVEDAADLALTSTVTAAAQGRATYTVTVVNKGPGTAADVEVVDPVVSGTVATSTASVGQVGGYAPSAIWRVGSLNPGVTATWTRTIAGGSGVGTVLVNQAGTGDPSPADTVSTAPQVLSGANLGLTREVNNTTPTYGQEVEFTLTATNAGPEPARGVTVAERPADGLAFVSADPGVGTYDGDAGRWRVGDLAPGAEATLTLRVRVTRAGEIGSGATISGQAPSDPHRADNVAEVALTASGGSEDPAYLAQTGFQLPYTNIRLSVQGATLVGAVLVLVGIFALVRLRQRRS